MIKGNNAQKINEGHTMSNFGGTEDGKKFRKSDGQEHNFRKDRKEYRKTERGDWHGSHDDKKSRDRKERRFSDEDKRPARFDKFENQAKNFEKTFKRDDDGKSFRPRRSDGVSPKQADLLEVCDLDRGIIKLIAKRAKVIERMLQFKSLDAATEKAIRTSWEQNTNKYCPDPKIARELFLLIQSVKAVDETDYDHAYNLAPLAKPVQVNLQAPASSRLARFYMMIAAASGQKTCMKNVALTDSLIHTIKSLNVLGGDLWFENNGTVFSRESKGLQRGSDKIIHVGSDEQSLWLCLALSLGLPYHLKITGENELCKINFAPIAKFLAAFNARLVQVIPASVGLPIRIEASGMIADTIKIPAELPMDFVFALILASPFWESPVRFDMTEYYASFEENTAKRDAWNTCLEDIMDCMTLCSLPVAMDKDSISSTPQSGAQSVHIPEEIVLASDAEICTSFFLLPALTSGTVTLKGHWTQKGQQKHLAEIMDFVGLEFSVDGGTATAKGNSGNAKKAVLPPCSEATKTLLTLWAKVNGQDIVLDHELKENAVCENFLALLGYTLDLERGEDVYAPFMAPTAQWAVAYALGAYLHPRVKLVNPNILNDYYPFFWRMYNTLPTPSIDKAERKDDTPKPRRVIAQGVYADLPKPVSADDD